MSYDSKYNTVKRLTIRDTSFNLTTLSAYTALEYLEIRQTSHQQLNLDCICSLSKLKALVLIDNKQLESIFPPREKCPVLSYFQLTNSSLTILPPLASFSHVIRDVRLSQNSIHSGFSSMEGLHLVKVDLSNNGLHDLDNLLSYTGRVEVLNLSNNSIERVHFTGETSQTRTVYLGKNNINHFDLSIEHNSIQVLYLNSNALESVPDCLQGYAALENLNLANNPIERFPEWFTRSLSRLKTLDVSGLDETDFDNLLTKDLAVEELDLSACELESFPEAVLTLPNLKRLKLNYNSTKTIPEAIKRCTNLEHLELRENDLDNIPQSIHQLPNLKYIDLTYNDIESANKLAITTQFEKNGVEVIW